LVGDCVERKALEQLKVCFGEMMSKAAASTYSSSCDAEEVDDVELPAGRQVAG